MYIPILAIDAFLFMSLYGVLSTYKRKGNHDADRWLRNQVARAGPNVLINGISQSMGCPALSKLAAMPLPMLPSPMNPTCMTFNSY